MENQNYNEKRSVKTSQDNYQDYNALPFFGDYGLTDIKFTKKEATMANGAKVALIHLSGYRPADGKRADVDFWPARCQTVEDIKKLPEHPQDIIIRFGRYTDETTGETVEASAPRVLGYFVGKEEVFFHGPKPVFEGGASVWTNEPEAK